MLLWMSHLFGTFKQCSIPLRRSVLSCSILISQLAAGSQWLPHRVHKQMGHIFLQRIRKIGCLLFCSVKNFLVEQTHETWESNIYRECFMMFLSEIFATGRLAFEMMAPKQSEELHVFSFHGSRTLALIEWVCCFRREVSHPFEISKVDLGEKAILQFAHSSGTLSLTFNRKADCTLESDIQLFRKYFWDSTFPHKVSAKV